MFTDLYTLSSPRICSNRFEFISLTASFFGASPPCSLSHLHSFCILMKICTFETVEKSSLIIGILECLLQNFWKWKQVNKDFFVLFFCLDVKSYFKPKLTSGDIRDQICISYHLFLPKSPLHTNLLSRAYLFDCNTNHRRP